MAAAFGVEPAHGRRIDEGKKLLLGTCLLPLVLLKVGIWDDVGFARSDTYFLISLISIGNILKTPWIYLSKLKVTTQD